MVMFTAVMVRKGHKVGIDGESLPGHFTSESSGSFHFSHHCSTMHVKHAHTSKQYRRIWQRVLYTVYALKSRAMRWPASRRQALERICSGIRFMTDATNTAFVDFTEQHAADIYVAIPCSARAARLDLLFGSKKGFSPIPTARLPFLSPMSS